MKKGEVIFYSGLIAICSIYIIYTLISLPLGSLTSPGPGFLPIVLGITGLFLSIILFQSTLKKVLSGQRADLSDSQTNMTKNGIDGKKVRKFMEFFLLVGIYLLLFKKVNLLLSTFVLITLLAKVFELEGWIKPILMGAGFVAAIYLVFVWGFKIYL